LKTTRRSAENSRKFEESQQETAFKNVTFHQGGRPNESSWSPNAAKAAPPAHGIKQLAFQPIFGSQTRMQKTRYTAQNTAKL